MAEGDRHELDPILLGAQAEIGSHVGSPLTENVIGTDSTNRPTFHTWAGANSEMYASVASALRSRAHWRSG